MHDFGPVCYLDVQKTGSTFISDFLARHMASPALKFAKHAAINNLKSLNGKAFFISVRDPYAQYQSLYRYGLERSGGVSKRLRQNPQVDDAALYCGGDEGFSTWLRFVLDPAHHTILNANYPQHAALLFGFQTYRFLRLALPNPKTLWPQMENVDDVRRIFTEHRLYGEVIYQERLNADLMGLCTGTLAPFLKDKAAALAELSAGATRINTTADQEFVADDDARQRIISREWFLYEVLGYDAPPPAPKASQP
ncbi:MAG: hypothetical protein AAGJ94_09035 [Pseudomonadota bacterium]